MWPYFEPELARRLEELDVDDSASARACGAPADPAVDGWLRGSAGRLGVSSRTLRRGIADEGTTFQRQTGSAREAPAQQRKAMLASGASGRGGSTSSRDGRSAGAGRAAGTLRQTAFPPSRLTRRQGTGSGS